MFTKLRRLNGHTDTVWDVATTNDNIYTASWDGKVLEWDVHNGNMGRDFSGDDGHAGQVWSCDIDTKNDVLLTVGDDLNVKGWDLKSSESDENGYGKLHGTVEGVHESPVYFVRSLPSEKESKVVFVTGSQDGSIKTWVADLENDFRCKEPLQHLEEAHDGGVLCGAVGIAADGNSIFATSGSDTCVRIWDIKDEGLSSIVTLGKDRDEVVGHNAAVSCIAFPRSTGHGMLATGSWDGVAILWDMRCAAPMVASWEAHRQNLSGVVFYGDTVCITASSDQEDAMKLWDLRLLRRACIRSGGQINPYEVVEPWQVMSRHTNTICGLQMLPDESQVVSVSSDQSAVQWHAQSLPFDEKEPAKSACCSVQ
jgi:WD40 repeat protein